MKNMKIKEKIKFGLKFFNSSFCFFLSYGVFFLENLGNFRSISNKVIKIQIELGMVHTIWCNWLLLSL